MEVIFIDLMVSIQHLHITYINIKGKPGKVKW